MRRIAWSDRVTQPWKNGGGVTHELLREGDGVCGFALRLSIAEVAGDGSFSRFPGVDRSILMLEGGGFRLTGPGDVTIREVAAPFGFAGEDAWQCTLLDGPVRDFNVMVDRTALRAEVSAAVGRVDLGPRGFVLALVPCRVGGIGLDRWDLLDGAGEVVLTERAVVVRVAAAARREYGDPPRHPGGPVPTRIASVADLEAHVGKPLGVSEWREMPFSQIVAFAEATGDRQWIHLDRERAASGPFGAPIAHGYLTLSLVAGLFFEVLTLENFAMIINYGCNKVRFPNPMKEGARYRLSMTLQSTKAVKEWQEAVFEAAIELDGEDKPAVAAEVVYRLLPKR